MSAFDAFRSFNDSLPEPDKKQIKDLIAARTAELLAARSEDAKVRLVSDYIEGVRELLVRQRG